LFVGEVVCGVLVESGFIFFCEGGLHVGDVCVVLFVCWVEQ
jgi:hypothetical protein